MTKKEAKRLSILKWKFIVANGGEYRYDGLPQELKNVGHNNSYCGYCKRYLHEKDDSTCGICPLNYKHEKDEFGCLAQGHPFSTWAEDKTVENAQAVLDLIRKS